MQRTTKILLLFFFANLVGRLLFLCWHPAEYTDGIRMMTPGYLGRERWLPLYPVLLRILDVFARDPVIAGRLLAIIAAAATVFPLFFLAKRLWGEKAAWDALILYSVCAIAVRWSPHVMSETLFGFLVIGSLWAAFAYLQEYRALHLVLFSVLSALCAVTRPEGIIFLPCAIIFHAHFMYRYGYRKALPATSSLAAWLLLPLWTLYCGRFFYGATWVGGATTLSWTKLARFLTAYLESLPYTVGYPTFLLAIAGAYYAAVTGKKRQLAFTLLLVLAWIIALSVHWAWSPRFLYCHVILAIAYAAGGLKLLSTRVSARSRRVALATCLVYGIVFTGLVLAFQRDSFGDVKRAAVYLRKNPPQGRVLADEPRKIAFWSGITVEQYDPAGLRPGDTLVLQSYLTNMRRALYRLDQAFDWEPVYHAASSIVPILGDDLVQPHVNFSALEEPTGDVLFPPHEGILDFITDTERRIVERFRIQRFVTKVIRIKRRRGISASTSP